MFYKITATWESGKTRKYEVKGMIAVMKMVDRLKATSNIVTCKDKLVDCNVTKAD